MKALKLLLFLYRKSQVFYRFGSCRFYPTCSHYAEEAIEKHGFFCGVFLAFKRLIRCNQFFRGGFDPVP